MNPPETVKPILRDRDMPLLDHLEELRKRLIWCVIFALAGFIVAYIFSDPLYQFLMKPVLQALQGRHQSQLHFTGLTEPFLVQLKVAFFGGLILAAPVIFMQFWSFAAPGLYEKERFALFITVLFSVVLFIAGICFAYFVVFPVGFQFFLSFSTQDILPVLTISEYLTFSVRLLFGFGLIFEMPLVILMLSIAGILDAKSVWSFWRYAIVMMAVASAILTPPDAASMLLMMIPMIALYGLSILLAALFGKKRPAKPA